MNSSSDWHVLAMRELEAINLSKEKEYIFWLLQLHQYTAPGPGSFIL